MIFKTGYSIKKALASTFLMLVSMVILAHAVIPHHHHDGIPVVAAHNENEGNTTNHDTDEYWLLSMVKVRLGNDKQTFQSLDFDYNLLPCFLTLFSDQSTCQIKDDVGLLFRQKPYLLSDHTKFIACSKGLRAPPDFN